MKRFLVRFWCGVCGKHVRTLLRGTPCPRHPNSHVRLRPDDPLVRAWWHAHHEPHCDILEEV